MKLFGWLRRGKKDVTAGEAFSPMVQIGERTHVRGVPYMLPKDMGEVNRLDFQHYMLRFALRGNYAAPLERPASILDVGTGTGRWAREMAQIFPSARVVGLDIVPPAADDAAESGAAPDPRPPNYTFAAGNVLEGLPFPDGAFDFVHQRLLYSAIPVARWQHVVNELIRVTAPGGWVEMVEGGMIQGDGKGLHLLAKWGIEACAKRGIDLEAGSRIDTFLKQGGLADVTMRPIGLPVGNHAGHLGRMVAMDLSTIFDALRGPVVASGAASAQEYGAALEAYRYETDHERYVFPVYVAFGRRRG